MRAVARYSFLGDPVQSQLSFPIGATISAKSKSMNRGWMWGEYNGMHGWFPVAYVEFIQSRSPHHKPSHVVANANPSLSTNSPLRKSMTTTTAAQTPRFVSPDTSMSEIPPLQSISFETPSPTAAVAAMHRQDFSNQNDNFQAVMGGEPGQRFDLDDAPITVSLSSPIYPTSVAQVDSPSSPTVLYPTDVYHKSRSSNARGTAKNAKRQQVFKSTDVAIFVTDKEEEEEQQPPKPTIQEPPEVKRETVTSPEHFWKAHPPRATTAGPPSRSEQAVALERAFDNLDDHDKIEIAHEPKHKFRIGIPKKFKKMVSGGGSGMKVHNTSLGR